MNTLKKLYRLVECCLNWRVIASLAAVGVALFLFAPKLAATSLPILVALVCPISMLVMLVSMGRMNMQGRHSEVSEPAPALQNLNRQQQLQLLEERLDRVRLQREEIASQLPELEHRQTKPEAAVVAGAGRAESQAAGS